MAKLKSYHSTKFTIKKKRERHTEKENCDNVRYFKESSEWFSYSCHENLAHDANKTITMTSLHGLCC